jgi:hypothetical protein
MHRDLRERLGHAGSRRGHFDDVLLGDVRVVEDDRDDLRMRIADQ